MKKNPRAKIKALDVMVSDVTQETDDTVTLSLFTGNDTLAYEPGHFLTISPHQFPGLQRWVRYLEYIKGRKEPPRAYSLSSSPDEKELAITIKEEQYLPGVTPFPPLLSPILARRTPRGTRMTITGFTGPYTLSAAMRSGRDHILHVCAGSGIVPSYSILKHDLRVNGKLRHTLVYSNKTMNDVIFRRQLESLEKEFPRKLRVLHTLTRERDRTLFNGNIRPGRVSRSLLGEVIGDPEKTGIFVCGPDHAAWQKKLAKREGRTLPPSFLQSTVRSLADLEIPRSAIKTESYG